MWNRRFIVAASVACAVSPAFAEAQPLGQFRWQLQPFCNVVTLNVVQSGGVYQLDGFDDQCGGATPRAAVVGTAFLNPDGSVGMGLTIVTAPAGTPLHVDAALNPVSINGTWRDSSGNTGAFVFTPGGPIPGGRRPAPRSVFPAGLSAGGTAIVNVGTPVAASDAANRGYVDGVAAAKANRGDVSLVVPVVNSGWSGVLPAVQLALGSSTFTTPRAGHLLVAMNVTGNVACASASSSFVWIVVDGDPVRSSVRVIGERTGDFTFTGLPPVSVSGITAGVVPAGAHTVAVHIACDSGMTAGYAYSTRFTGVVTVLDESYASRAAAPDAASQAEAADCLVARAADGTERRQCR